MSIFLPSTVSSSTARPQENSSPLNQSIILRSRVSAHVLAMFLEFHFSKSTQHHILYFFITTHLPVQERFTDVQSSDCGQSSVSTGVVIGDTDTPVIQISTPRSSAAGSGMNMIGDCQIDLYSDGTSKTLGDDLGTKVSVTQNGPSTIRIAYPETAGK